MRKNIVCCLLWMSLLGCKVEDKNSGLNIPEAYMDHLMAEQKYLLMSSGTRIDFETELMDKNGGKSRLKDLIGQENKLVFRFSDIDCNPCIDHEIALIKKQEGKIDFNKIIFLVSYENPRQFRIFTESIKIPVELYAIEKERLKLPAEKAGKPYYFLVNATDQKPFCIFFPEKTMDQFTHQFFEIVTARM